MFSRRVNFTSLTPRVDCKLAVALVAQTTDLSNLVMRHDCGTILTIPCPQKQVDMEVRGENEAQRDYLGCGYWSEGSGGWRTDGMALGSLGDHPDTNTAVIQCATFHLSTFASREDSATPQWNRDDLFIDFRLLAKVGHTQNSFERKGS